MSRSLLLAPLLCLAGSLSAYTINYPFPYQAAYPHGIKAAVKTGDIVQSKFDAWKSSYYEVCSDASKARVKWQDGTSTDEAIDTGYYTVSEGIGYGMLIVVYMDNASNQTKPMFDKLWAYYQNFLDGNGLMNWKIAGCSSTNQTGAAPDADEDVALALCMAYKQWGDASYLTAAQSLLAKIWNKEVNSSTYLMKIDDQGTSDNQNLYNPSYFSVGAYRVFAAADNSHAWATVATNTLALIAKNRNSTTGLVSDWCNSSGATQDHNSSGSGKFGYDAVRTPWRVALDYLWFGTDSAKSELKLMDNWIQGSFSAYSYIYAGYTQAGVKTTSSDKNALYAGAFMMPAVVNNVTGDSAWIAKGYTALSSSPSSASPGWDGNYFNMSWKVLYLLTITGNFQNLWGTVATTGISEAQEVPAPTVWSAHAGSDAIELRGSGPARAQLLDLQGHVLSQGWGDGDFSLRKPAARGTYLVRILGEQPQTIPVFSN